MTLLRRLVAGFRGLFQTTRTEREMDDELRGYLEAAADQKMLAGLSREEAIRAAHAETGSVEAVKDRIRDVGWESNRPSLGIAWRSRIAVAAFEPLHHLYASGMYSSVRSSSFGTLDGSFV